MPPVAKNLMTALIVTFNIHSLAFSHFLCILYLNGVGPIWGL